MKKQDSKKQIPVKSQIPLHLTIRGPNYEFSLDATASRIMKDLESIKGVMDSLNTYIAGVHSTTTILSTRDTTSEAPAITASKSTMDNIEALFKTSWGQESRSVAEVVKALEANAVPDTTTYVSVCLNRLVKKHLLRRIKKAGKWQYYTLPSG